MLRVGGFHLVFGRRVVFEFDETHCPGVRHSVPAGWAQLQGDCMAKTPLKQVVS